MIDFIKEFWEFLRERKNIGYFNHNCIGLVRVLIVLSQGSAVAPFIYTIF